MMTLISCGQGYGSEHSQHSSANYNTDVWHGFFCKNLTLNFKELKSAYTSCHKALEQISNSTKKEPSCVISVAVKTAVDDALTANVNPMHAGDESSKEVESLRKQLAEARKEIIELKKANTTPSNTVGQIDLTATIKKRAPLPISPPVSSAASSQTTGDCEQMKPGEKKLYIMKIAKETVRELKKDNPDCNTAANSMVDLIAESDIEFQDRLPLLKKVYAYITYSDECKNYGNISSIQNLPDNYDKMDFIKSTCNKELDIFDPKLADTNNNLQLNGSSLQKQPPANSRAPEVVTSEYTPILEEKTGVVPFIKKVFERKTEVLSENPINNDQLGSYLKEIIRTARHMIVAEASEKKAPYQTRLVQGKTEILKLFDQFKEAFEQKFSKEWKKKPTTNLSADNKKYATQLFDIEYPKLKSQQ